MDLNFIGVLPDEICVKILDFLDVKSLCRALQTCSSWRALIESCSSMWKGHCKRYQGSLPGKRNFRKVGTLAWKAELKKVFLLHKVMKRWLAGEFSFVKSYEALPGDHIQQLPTEMWGAILENEMNRNKPQHLRTQ